jgi:hypothetical protein
MQGTREREELGRPAGDRTVRSDETGGGELLRPYVERVLEPVLFDQSLNALDLLGRNEARDVDAWLVQHQAPDRPGRRMPREFEGDGAAEGVSDHRGVPSANREDCARIVEFLAKRVRRRAVVAAPAAAAIDEEELEAVGEPLGDGKPAQ